MCHHFCANFSRQLTPNWKVVDEQATLTGINTHGLGTDYIRMRRDAEDAHLLDRETLRKIGAVLGVRYIFQPRLASFTQTMTERWKFPGVDLRLVQTRSSMMRISLQLWDAESGELIWSSVAEAVLANEAVIAGPGVPGGCRTGDVGQPYVGLPQQADSLTIYAPE